MWLAVKTFFSNWTPRHWLNFGIFLFGGLVTTFGITASTPWSGLLQLFTPLTTIGYFISLLGFLLSTATGEPRDPQFGTRATDPNPTAPLVVVDHHVEAVPPMTPGRPLDPDTKEP